MALPTLFSQASPARTESGLSLASGAFPWPDGNERIIFVTGVFDNALVQAQVSPDAKTWFDYEEPLFQEGTLEAELQPGAYLRLVIKGGSLERTRLTAWV